MRVIAIGLAAALFAAALSPAAAFAKDKPPAAAEGQGDAKSHLQGMTDVPPLIQQVGVTCTPSDANFLGQGTAKDAAGKSTVTKVYEVVCQEGLGYMIMSPTGGMPSAFDCLAMSTNKPKPGAADKGAPYCKLAPNADPTLGIGALLAKAGIPNCTVAQARYMGSATDASLDEYEIACSSGGVYVIQDPRKSSSQKLVAVDCMTLKQGDCEYLPKDKFLATLSSIATPANRPCQVTDAKWMGSLATGESFYELACQDEKAGYVLEVTAQNQYVKSIDCARATAIGSGCTLTAASAAQTQETGTYTQLAKQVGFPCNVKAYHSFGTDKQGREVVELSCSDRPDGAIAILPVDKGQTGEFWNCVRAETHQLQCSLTPKANNFAKLTSQVTAAGKSCQVSDARAVGTGEAGDDYVEVLCSVGGGYFIDYASGADSVKSVIPCGMASGIGGGCKLGK